MTEEGGFLLASVAMGKYQPNSYDDIRAEHEPEEVYKLLVPYGAHKWIPSTGTDSSGADWVNAALRGWTGPRTLTSSLLFWVGHGESTGQSAWLATAHSRPFESMTGYHPDALGRAILEEWVERRQNASGAWTIIVVEACGAETFVRRVLAEINNTAQSPSRIALIGTGGEGTAFLGTFSKALARVIARFDSEINTHEISITDLVWAIEDQLELDVRDEQAVITVKLGRATPLRRQSRALSDVTGAVDVVQELQDLMAGQPPDQVAHFIPKAQGAEPRELAWYFEGRAEQRRAIRRWIDANDTGMLVVTGAPGAGKSALLGNLVVHANERLRDLLVRLAKLDALPEDEDPTPARFRDFILLTGVSARELVDRLARLVGGQHDAPRLTLEERTEHLMASARETPVTVLVDALDEAQEPFRLARLLRQFAAVPGCRIVLGTRASTQEGPDLSRPEKEDILDELNAGGPLAVIRLIEDPDAVERYVTRRLSDGYGRKGPAIPADAIARVARNIGTRKRGFLYARLAVHELINAPDLLTEPNRADDLERLLASNHGQLFGQAVRRLGRHNPGYEFLLKALAFGKGRGLPRAGRVWRLVANALTGEDPLVLVTENDIDAILLDAAPYIMVDGEDGQTVYRLAHRTFQEFFVARNTP